MFDDEVCFEILDSGNYLRIKPIQRLSYNYSDHDWDKNWVNTYVELKAGCFSGKLTAEFTTSDFQYLYNQFGLLSENMNGFLEFSNLEGNLKFKIKGDGIGHFGLTGSAYSNMDENKLDFRFCFDQTLIKELEKQLYLIIKKYPIVGSLGNG